MPSASDGMKAIMDRFDESAAAGLDLVFGFNIDEGKQFFSLIVKDGTCELQEGKNADANITLITDTDTLLTFTRAAHEPSYVTSLVQNGKMWAEGDTSLILKFMDVFFE